jgi:hypothetical protein
VQQPKQAKEFLYEKKTKKVGTPEDGKSAVGGNLINVRSGMAAKAGLGCGRGG